MTARRVREGILAVTLPFGDGHEGATTGYLITGADGSVTVLDPGWDTDGNVRRLADALAGLGRTLDDVALVAVTHLHPDHLGAADRLRRRSGARVALHPAEQRALHQGPPATHAAWWGVPQERREELVRAWNDRRFPQLAADLLIEDGATLPIPGRTITAVWTPGHTTGSLCFLDAADGLLFTGDHLLPEINPGVGLGGPSPTNPLADYLASLDRLRPYGDLEACPGHGAPFRPLGRRRAALAAHQRQRTAAVAAALDRLEQPTVWQLAAHLTWSDGWGALAGYRLASALAQTELHVALLGRSGQLASPAPGGPEE